MRICSWSPPKDAIKLCLEVRAELGMPMMVETAQVEVPFEISAKLDGAPGGAIATGPV